MNAYKMITIWSPEEPIRNMRRGREKYDIGDEKPYTKEMK